MNYNEVYHDRDIFVEDYKEMNRSFKIYVYPHRRNDPFANVLLPMGSEPGVIMLVKVTLRRKKLAFFAGKINSPVREKLLQVWRNDTEIFAHSGRLKTPYADELLGSKFCLHVKGYEVNTARIADSLYYGCVPVIIADYHDLPFADILNLKSFSIDVATLDIPLLKKILKRFSFEEYLMLQRNALKVRKHFQWHLSPVDYDAFYMVMYELWLRRSSVRLPSNAFVHPN
ncbi:putative glycosyltransferase [Quercus suber]|uniref:Glycosyltransferase n=1 Tax=Quercus suber TaxID=58331 RepID=A0AAW0LY06_QUESU